jgi:hypothetical protein
MFGQEYGAMVRGAQQSAQGKDTADDLAFPLRPDLSHRLSWLPAREYDMLAGCRLAASIFVQEMARNQWPDGFEAAVRTSRYYEPRFPVAELLYPSMA